MGKLFLWMVLATAVLSACKKESFDINNPDVTVFVQQLKSGTYTEYEKDENGRPLWLKRPFFRQEHIGALIELSKDTTHITKFPTSPISSQSPFPEGRDYFILGECLLWLVDGIRGAGSMNPYLIDNSKDPNERYKGVTAAEIWMLSDLYKEWWNNHKNGDWKTTSALTNTSYGWVGR